MYKVLVPVDGSAVSAAAVRHAIGLCRSRPDAELHVINVQPRLTRHAARFLPKSAIDAERRRRGDAALAKAREALADAGITARTRVLAGVVADEVAEYARGQNVQQIVVGTKRKSTLSRLLGGSVVNRLVELAVVPVAVVAGPAAGPLERYVLPAGLGLGLSLLLMGE